jgi:hypothetical protein
MLVLTVVLLNLVVPWVVGFLVAFVVLEVEFFAHCSEKYADEKPPQAIF